MAEIWRGEEVVGNVDDEGNVWRGEEIVGNISTTGGMITRRAGAALLLLL